MHHNHSNIRSASPDSGDWRDSTGSCDSSMDDSFYLENYVSSGAKPTAASRSAPGSKNDVVSEIYTQVANPPFAPTQSDPRTHSDDNAFHAQLRAEPDQGAPEEFDQLLREVLQLFKQRDGSDSTSRDHEGSSCDWSADDTARSEYGDIFEAQRRGDSSLFAVRGNTAGDGSHTPDSPTSVYSQRSSVASDFHEVTRNSSNGNSSVIQTPLTPVCSADWKSPRTSCPASDPQIPPVYLAANSDTFTETSRAGDLSANSTHNAADDRKSEDFLHYPKKMERIPTPPPPPTTDTETDSPSAWRRMSRYLRQSSMSRKVRP